MNILDDLRTVLVNHNYSYSKTTDTCSKVIRNKEASDNTLITKYLIINIKPNIDNDDTNIIDIKLNDIHNEVKHYIKADLAQANRIIANVSAFEDDMLVVFNNIINNSQQ